MAFAGISYCIAISGAIMWSERWFYHIVSTCFGIPFLYLFFTNYTRKKWIYWTGVCVFCIYFLVEPPNFSLIRKVRENTKGLVTFLSKNDVYYFDYDGRNDFFVPHRINPFLHYKCNKSIKVLNSIHNDFLFIMPWPDFKEFAKNMGVNLVPIRIFTTDIHFKTVIYKFENK